MPSKRDPGKQGRQARNQARRQALALRREQAAASASAAAEARETIKAGGDAAPRRGGVFGGLLGGGARAAARPAPAPIGTTGERPVGWRAGLAALLMAVVGLAGLALTQVTVDPEGTAVPTVELASLYQIGAASVAGGVDAAYEGSPPESVAATVEQLRAGPGDEANNALSAYWPRSLLFPVPVLVAGLAFWVLHQGTARGRQLMFLLFGMFFAAMMTGIYFLPALVALGVASFQVRKAEAAVAMAARREAEAETDADDGDVIDVDEVDDDLQDDEDLADDELEDVEDSRRR